MNYHNFFFRYGDRYPSSALGQVFTVTWCLIGIVLNALLVCALTSSISVKLVEEILQAKPGTFVGVVKDSPGEYFVDVLKRSGGSGENLKLSKCQTV